MKKRVLCFGDSLTWGFNPQDCSRFEDEVRWTGVLQNMLGDEYKIIEEGQNGRVIAVDDEWGEKNGLTYLAPCMESQNPLYAMVIMLGTNDLKARFNFSAKDIADEMNLFLEKVQMINANMLGTSLKIILMSPPVVADDMMNSPYGEEFGYGRAREISVQLADLYKSLAQKYNIYFLDAEQYVKTSPIDSIHIEANQQEKLATAVCKCIMAM